MGPTAETVLVLVSGGLDSAVTLWWAQRRGWEIRALTFNYHLRPRAELQACRDLLAALGRPPPLEVDLPFLREVTDRRPLGNPHLRRAPEGYIPARNLVFYALALHEAELLGARYILGGHNSGDSHVFPDASPPFFAAMNGLARLGLWSFDASPVEILLPLAGLSKVEVLRLGLELGVPFERTWSCYADGPLPCGRCESCRERGRAFGVLGLPDPAPRAASPGAESSIPPSP